MKKLSFALLLLVIVGFQRNLFAGDINITTIPQAEFGQQKGLSFQVDPRDVEYAKYLFKEDWASHLGDIVQKRKENMGSVDPTQVNSVIGLNNFFFFVTAADLRMGFYYVALDGYLKNAQKFDEAMREGAEEHDATKCESQVNYLLYPDGNIPYNPIDHLSSVLSDARVPILKAAAIYQVPIKEVASTDPNFKDISKTFAAVTLSEILKLIRQAGNPGWYAGDPYNAQGRLSNLLEKASFSYEKSGGETGYVSFVTFGKFALHKWSGTYGGDGAFDAASVQFLDLY